jgi:TonB family protein
MRYSRWVLVGLLGCGWARAQSSWQERLVGHPLYLRGAWVGPVLEFDGAGRPLHDAPAGALTLSGVDVQSLAVHGSRMQIQGYRVMLVADDGGVLQRRNQTSTTELFLTYRKTYESRDAVKITLHADAAGSFGAALAAVFADGLADLAVSVPPAWSCYAQAYFPGSLAKAAAEQQVDACVRRKGAGIEAGSNGVSYPKMEAPLQVRGTREGARSRLEGESCIHFSVGAHGVPLRLQVVRAVGAGMDEMVLQALSASRFEPAMRDGKAVPADMEFTMQFHPPQAER